MRERRRFGRVRTGFHMMLTLPNGRVLAATTVDVSPAGVMVDTDREVLEGDSVVAQFEIEELAAFRFKAQLVHYFVATPCPGRERVVRVGLEFVDTPADAIAPLMDFVYREFPQLD